MASVALVALGTAPDRDAIGKGEREKRADILRVFRSNQIGFDTGAACRLSQPPGEAVGAFRARRSLGANAAQALGEIGVGPAEAPFGEENGEPRRVNAGLGRGRDNHASQARRQRHRPHGLAHLRQPPVLSQCAERREKSPGLRDGGFRRRIEEGEF